MTEWIEEARSVVRLTVAAEPLAVALDPDNKLLGTAEEQLLVGVSPEEAPRPAPLLARPNPFRAGIEIEAEEGGTVEVFDVRGRRLQRLHLAGGRVYWDGQDASGRPVAPGAYFVRVPSTGETARIVRLPAAP